MTPRSTQCVDAAPHAWSEWWYDESATGAVHRCTRCSTMRDRSGTVIAQASAAPATASVPAKPDAALPDPLLAALGGSLLYDALKGDFRQAATLADAALAHASAAPARADAMIDRAVIHALQGAPRPARELLEEALRLVPDDTDRRLRATTYLLRAAHLQYNVFPDGGGAGASEINARWDGVTELRALDIDWHLAMGNVSSTEIQFESWLSYAFETQLLPQRAMLDARRTVPSAESLDALLAMSTQPAMQLHTLATTQSLPALTAFADWATADLHRRAGDLPTAHTFLERARTTYCDIGDRAGEALCLMSAADWQAAPFSSPVCWDFAMSDSSQPSSDLPAPVEAGERHTGATVSYAAAATLFRAAGAMRGAAAVLLRQGYGHSLSSAWNDAARCAQEAQRLFDEVGDARGAQLAQTHLLLCSLSGASVTLDHHAVASSIGTWGASSGSFSYALGLGILVNRLARHCLLRRGDYERALTCSRTAQVLFDALGARINSTQCRVDQGLIHMAVGERSAALVLLERAVDDYAAQIPAVPRIATNLRERVTMLTIEVYQLALQATDPDAMDRATARLKVQIAALPAMRDLQSAMVSLESRIAALQRGESPPDEPDLTSMMTLAPLGQMGDAIMRQASVLSPLYRARTARKAGDAQQSAHWLLQAESALGDDTNGETQFLRAMILAERRLYPAAAAAMREYVGAGGANAGFVGDILEVLQEHGGSRGSAEAMLQQRRTHQQAFAAFVAVRAYDDAALHRQALETLDGAEWWRNDSRPWQPLCDSAELHEARGDGQRARADYDRAIDELESRRASLSRDELKVALASDKGAQYLYFLAARAAVRAGDAAAGLAYAERGKSRALLDLMASARGATATSETSQLRDWRERSMQLAVTRGLLGQVRAQSTPDATRIVSLEAQVGEREAALRTAEAALSAANPRFRELVSPTASLLSADDVQRALPENGLLLEYFMLGDDLLAWAIPRAGPIAAHHATVDVAALTREVQALHAACDEGLPWRALADSLAATLLQPFASQIRTAASILIVPHGALHLLPFHLLPADGDVLAAAHNLSYLPSASTLQLLRAPDAMPVLDRILVVGNPTGDLPSSRAEAEFVAAQFPQAVLLLEDAATEAAVRARLPGMPLVHFATHGTLDAETPLNSSVALAQNDELTVYELMSLRLDARLVVLSACSTGQGESTGGDDLLGLTRGLLAAGAQAALVTLWPVDDHATALFMQEFYVRLRGGLSPRAALQRAQHHVRFMAADEIASRTRGAHRLVRNAVNGAPASTQPSTLSATPYSARHDVTAPPAWTAASTPVPDEVAGYGHPYFWAPFVLVGR